jgi:hypothetical protein
VGDAPGQGGGAAGQGQGQGQGGGAPAAGPTTAELATRIDGIATKLDALLNVLPGKGAPAPAEGGGGGQPPAQAPAADMGSMVRAEVEKIRAADAAAAKAKGESDWRANVDAAIGRIPEIRPADPQTGVRGVLQRLIVGTPREQRDRQRQPAAAPGQGQAPGQAPGQGQGK